MVVEPGSDPAMAARSQYWPSAVLIVDTYVPKRTQTSQLYERREAPRRSVGTIRTRFAYPVIRGTVMRPKLLLLALVAGLLWLTACDFTDLGDMERFNRDFHYSYALGANGRLSVETFNGSV